MKHSKAFGRLAAAVLAIVMPAGAVFAEETRASTRADQKQVAVTVYNSNMALVRDVRLVDLPAGEVRLQFMDVAAKVNPATVHIVSETAPKELAILEQDYEYDLLSPQKLLNKYVGKEVTLVRLRQENSSTREDDVKAILVADNDNQPVWKVGGEIVTGMGADRYVFTDLPGNLYSKPTLIWLLDNHHTGQQTVEAQYLTDGLNWNADYVLTVSTDQKSADLNGWVTLVNETGTEFKDALLQLVAGAVHRVPRPVPAGVAGGEIMVRAAAAPSFQQEALSEYRLYTLSRPTTLQDNETKQISLLAAAGFPVEKRLVVDGQTYYYRNPVVPSAPIKDAVEVHLKFKNAKASGLGVPLPAGTVRVYQNDSKGRVQFIGEDSISHTPKDETLDLHIGDAFDVVEERKQTDYRKIDRHVSEMAFEITLRNHKPDPVTVEVNEPFGGDWTIEESNFKYEKTSAFSARFTVPVEANATAALNYRVRVRW